MSSWTLHIKELQGATVDIPVNPRTDKVIDLKQAYHRCEHSVPPYQQRLVFDHAELSDERSLSSYPEIEDGATIYLIRLVPFQLFVKGMDGSSHTLSIPTKTPERYLVSQLKKLVQERTGVRPEEQRLQYAGKQLVDTCTLGDYNLTNNATLHLVSRLRGGSSCMSCGRRVMSLYSHCMSEVRNSKTCVSCPYCRCEWNLKWLKLSKQLTSTQISEIEEGLTRNFCLSMPGVMSCELCGGVWGDGGLRGSLCPSCVSKTRNETQETLKVLAGCETKKIDHALSCPAIRACPKCGKLIQHTEACRRVDCDSCNTTFCFVCLTIREPISRPYYPCPVEKCPTAPRQTTLPRSW